MELKIKNLPFYIDQLSLVKQQFSFVPLNNIQRIKMQRSPDLQNVKVLCDFDLWLL